MLQLLGPIERLEARIREVDERLRATRDALLYGAADFENYKRQHEQDRTLAEKLGQATVVGLLVPLARGFTEIVERGGEDAFAQGARVIAAQFSAVLAKYNTR